MSPVTTPPAAVSPVMIAAVILGVLAFSAFLGWGAWRVFKSAERAERDPRYLRRRLVLLGLLYVGSAVYGIEQVVTGREPLQSLIGLPIGALLAWFYLRAAFRVKIPPA
jgi:uncharacterized membrane protein